MDDLVRLLQSLASHEPPKGHLEDPPLALATVVNTRGSAYRRPGARMLVRRSLAVQGAVSAGCLERDIVANCQYLNSDDKPVLLTYDGSSADELIFGLKLGCDGIVQILIEPLALQNSFGQPKFRRLEKLVPQLLSENGRLVAVTIFEMTSHYDMSEVGCAGLVMLETGSQTYELAAVPRTVSAYLRAQAQEVLQERRSGRSLVVSADIDGYNFSALIELVQPATSLAIFGSGQDVDPLVEMADIMGWRVTLIEESRNPAASASAREAQLRLAERFRRYPNTRVAVMDLETLPALLAHETINAAVVMTHDYERDGKILRHLLADQHRPNLPYIGVIGPRRRADKLLAELAVSYGLPLNETTLARLYSPIGLDVGAERPEEIALSILAEIKAVLAGHNGGHLREKQGPIHEPVKYKHVQTVVDRPAMIVAPAFSSDLQHLQPRQVAVTGVSLHASCGLEDA